MKRVVVLLLCYAAFATGARAQVAPCCSIAGINAATGVVSAKVNANGETFQFRLTNANLLKELRVGQGVYANFTTHQISIDGKSIAGPITAGPQAPAPAPAAPVPAPAPKPALPSRAPPTPAPAASPAAVAPPAQVPPPSTSAAPIGSTLSKGDTALVDKSPPKSPYQLCCTIIGGIDALYGGAIATVSGQAPNGAEWARFSFFIPQAGCPALSAAQANGTQQFSVDFATGLVSFDGRTPCGMGIHQVILTQIVTLDVLPVGVVYVPPGDPKLTGSNAPNQKFTSTTTFTNTTATATAFIQGSTSSAGVTLPFASVGTSGGSSTTTTTTTSYSVSQAVMTGETASGPGGYPGAFDRIVFYVNPKYVVTYNGAYLPQAGPGAKLTTTVSSTAPLNQAQWTKCDPTVQDLETDVGDAAFCLSQIAKPHASGNRTTTAISGALTPAQKLIGLDPMIAGVPGSLLSAAGFGALGGATGPQGDPTSVVANTTRFQAIRTAGWTECADSGGNPDPIPFGATSGTVQITSTSTQTKFNSGITATVNPLFFVSAIAGVDTPAGTSTSLGVGDTWENDFTTTSTSQTQVSLNTAGQFAGGTIPASSTQCSPANVTGYNTTLYYDLLSSTVLFWTQTFPPGSASDVSGGASPAPPPADGAHVIFTAAGGGRSYRVLMSPAGQYRLMLPPGNYTYQVADRTGRILAPAQRLTLQLSQQQKLPTISLAK